MLWRLRLRMVLAGAALLLGWVSYLTIGLAENNAALRERESAARGLIVAESLAKSIGRALEYGIDLADLRGIDTVFASHMKDNQYIAEIVLDDLEGRVQIPVIAPLRKGAAVSAAVNADLKAIGRVTVYLRQASMLEVISAPISIAMLIMLGAVLTLWEAVNYATRRGPGLREIAARGLLAQIAANDFRSVIKIGAINRIDIRSAWLSTQVRDLNERFKRVFRLIASLQKTEPRNAERLRLMELARQARGDAKFADARPIVNKLFTVAIDIRWLVFIAATSVSVNLFALGKFFWESQAYMGPLLMGLSALAAMAGFGLAKLWAKHQSAQVICCIGLLVLGGIPLVFMALLLGENIGPLGATGWEPRTGAGAVRGFRVSLVCLQSLGLGVFFAGLRSSWAQVVVDDVGKGKLPLVALSAWVLMGASLTWIWGEKLGESAVILLSLGLVMVTCFFYAISPIQKLAPDLAQETPDTLPSTIWTTATVLGFVLGTLIATAITRIFPAGAIDAPAFRSWPLIAMGIGFLACMASVRSTQRSSAAWALLASATLPCAMLLQSLPHRMIMSVVALAVLTFHAMNMLPKSLDPLTDLHREVPLRCVALGMAVSLLFFALCLYLAYSPAVPWALSIAGCLSLLIGNKRIATGADDAA